MNIKFTENQTLFTKIEKEYTSMTKAKKKIADYLRNSYTDVPFLSVHQMAKKADVSSASIVRFCQDLGYQGYASVQNELKQLVHKDMPPMREIRLSIAENAEAGEALGEVLRENIMCLESGYTPALREEFKIAAEKIATARTVYILGLRTTFSVAYYFYSMLGQIRDNIVLVKPDTGDVYDHLLDANADDVLIAISFSRYTRQTTEIADFLLRLGVQVIAITDSHTSPIARRAEIILLARNSPRTFSFVLAFTLANAFVVELGRQNSETAMKRLQRREKVADLIGIYI
ncbi:MAG: MurR/RpiR family transcriptional regulator [Acidaminococcaceae bacterium]